MSWRDLLDEPTGLIAPWLGGRALRVGARQWKIFGALPDDPGWYSFQLVGRRAHFADPTDPAPEALLGLSFGYLVGDRFVPDTQRVGNPARMAPLLRRVHLLDEGLGRFQRIQVGSAWTWEARFGNAPLIFAGFAFPLGPEPEVQEAFEDGKTSLDGVKGVSPALDAAFRYEVWRRAEAERRRLEAARRAAEEEVRLEVERRRAEIVERLGDGAGRREMAQLDFPAAARAALAVGGATYLDSRKVPGRDEHVVRYRLGTRRLECSCRTDTLGIIDAGFCLTAHYDDPDFAGGTRGDAWLTLESLPGVAREAIDSDRFVQHRIY